MVESNIRKFIFSSSAAIYGEPQKVPIPEEHPCFPVNPYGETKWIFERVLQRLHEAKKLDYISLRYFNAAGADPDGEIGEDHSPETHLIPISILAAINGKAIPIFGTDYDTPDGTCIRDYIHVTDLARLMYLLLKIKIGSTSRTYSLGNVLDIL
jgi:UDP-glucose 4-epimerase